MQNLKVLIYFKPFSGDFILRQNLVNSALETINSSSSRERKTILKSINDDLTIQINFTSKQNWALTGDKSENNETHKLVQIFEIRIKR